MTIWQIRVGATRAQFLLRRMIRLAGPFWMAAILVVGLSWLSSVVPGYRGLSFIFPNTTVLVCHLFYACDALDAPWLNPIFWTLAVEVQFYLLVALLFPFAHSKSGRVLIGLVIVLMLLLAPVAPEPSLFRYFPLFLIGFLGLIWRRRVLPVWQLTLCAMALLSSVAFFLGWVECLVALCTIAFIVRSDRAWTPLVWLGGISYSLYLVHVPVGARIMNFAERMDLQGGWLYLAGLSACAVTIGVAWAFWRCVELPCLRWSRSIGSTKLNPVLASPIERSNI